jgi:hypothetical protein
MRYRFEHHPRSSPSVRTVCAAAVAFAALGLLTQASTTSARAGLAFATAKPLSLQWNDLADGKRVAVCNGKKRAVRKAVVAFTGFGFKRHGHRLATSEVLRGKLGSRKIRGGRCTALVLSSVPGAKIEARSFSGAVAVTAAGAGVARLQLTVTRSQAVTAAAAAVSGAVEEATLHLINHTPTGAAGSQKVGDLLLKPGPEGGRPLPLGKECRQPSGDEGWDVKTCPLIGNLYQGTEIVHVFIAGKAVEGEGVEQLPVRIDSTEHLVGHYEGQLDPSLSGDEEQMVKTKLTASDSAVWAVLAVLLGAAIAIGLQVLSKRIRPKGLLLQRQEGIVATYRRGRDWDRKKRKITVDVDTAMTYSEKVGEAIRRLTGSALLVDTESEAYKQIDASIKLAEEDAKTLVAADGLSPALDTLEAEVEKAKTMLAGKYDLDQTPALLARASAPLAEGTLAVGEAIERAKAARTLAPLLRDWRQMAERIFGYEVWLIALDKRAKKAPSKKYGPAVDKEDRGKLTEVAIGLAELREKIFRASNESDLERIRASYRIEAVFANLSYVGGKYDVGAPTDIEAVLQTKASSLRAEVNNAFPQLTERTLDKKAKDVSWDEWEVDATPAVPAVMAAKKWWILAVDLLVLLAGATVAVVAALVGFYFDGPFGTLENYLTVIFTATAAQAVVSVVMENLSVFMHDISASTDAAPATAKIAPPPKEA